MNDKTRHRTPLVLVLSGSSEAEQRAVNSKVAGSIPARIAIVSLSSKRLKC